MRLTVHIGPPKTGSTSIQLFLRDHADHLRGRGILVPETHHANMAEMQYALRANIPDNRTVQRLGLEAGENDEETQAELLATFDEQIAAGRQVGDIDQVVITTEGLSKLGRPGVQRLQDWANQWFDAVEIVFVLRRQDKRAVSLYKNAVKNAGLEERQVLSHREEMNYADQVRPWANVFGAEHLHLLLFPDSVDEPRDLLRDFCALLGCADMVTDAVSQEYHRNATMDVRAIEVLRLLNKKLPEREFSDVPAALRLIERKLANMDIAEVQKPRPSREQAKEFMTAYAESNEEIRATYFPARDKLFSDTFDSYPETPHMPGPDVHFLVRLLADIVEDDEVNAKLTAE